MHVLLNNIPNVFLFLTVFLFLLSFPFYIPHILRIMHNNQHRRKALVGPVTQYEKTKRRTKQKRGLGVPNLPLSLSSALRNS